ncbi:MAG: hypothetical protein ABI295_02990, partial [Xanthomarina sp.]
TGTAPGNYRIRIRQNSYSEANTNSTYFFDSCGNINHGGETEDYTFTVLPRCDAQITSITNGEACGTNESIELNVTGSTGVSSYRWYNSRKGGTPLATTPTGTWNTPIISETTVYWVEAYNGCWSYERERVVAFLNAPATLTFIPAIPQICGENNPPIQIQASSTTQIDYLIDEDFEGSGLGSFTQNNIRNGGPAALEIST